MALQCGRCAEQETLSCYDLTLNMYAHYICQTGAPLWQKQQLSQQYIVVHSSINPFISFSFSSLSLLLSSLQISRLCAEEAAAQEQTGQVEECLKVNLLKIKQEACKKVQFLHFVYSAT